MRYCPVQGYIWLPTDDVGQASIGERDDRTIRVRVQVQVCALVHMQCHPSIRASSSVRRIQLSLLSGTMTAWARWQGAAPPSSSPTPTSTIRKHAMVSGYGVIGLPSPIGFLNCKPGPCVVALVHSCRPLTISKVHPQPLWMDAIS